MHRRTVINNINTRCPTTCVYFNGLQKTNRRHYVAVNIQNNHICEAFRIRFYSKLTIRWIGKYAILNFRHFWFYWCRHYCIPRSFPTCGSGETIRAELYAHHIARRPHRAWTLCIPTAYLWGIDIVAVVNPKEVEIRLQAKATEVQLNS